MFLCRAVMILIAASIDLLDTINEHLTPKKAAVPNVYFVPLLLGINTTCCTTVLLPII